MNARTGRGDASPRIRPGGPEDAGSIADVFLAARAGMPYLPRPHSDEQTRAWIAEVMLPDCQVWIAEPRGQAAKGGPVLGFAAVRDGWLEHLYVTPVAQGRGVGAALLRQAKQERPDGLSLYVFQQNALARRFYERHGFTLVGLGDGSDNEERLPDACYRWQP